MFALQGSNLAVMSFQYLKCFYMTLVILVQIVLVSFFISEHVVLILWNKSDLHNQLATQIRKREAMKVGPYF